MISGYPFNIFEFLFRLNNNYMKRVKVSAIIALCCALTGWGQNNFYSQGSLHINLTSSWNTQPNGSGTEPINFHTAGQVFYVQNGHQMTASGSWTVSGTGSKVVVTSGGQITSGSYNHWILALDLEENARYVMNHSTFSSLNFGTMHPGGIFQMNTNSGFRPTLTYPTLVLNFSGTFNQTSVKATGGVIVKSGATWRGSSNTANTHEIASITVESGGSLEGVAGTGSCAYNINGSLLLQPGSTYNANGSSGTAPVFTFSGSSGEITFAGNVLSANHNINVTGTRDLGDDLPVGSSRTISVSGTLACSSCVITGNGSFELLPGATLKTAHPDGLNGVLAITGSKTLDEDAHYNFNGSSAQVTGTFLPATVQSLVIDNPAGVTISSDDVLTVSGLLTINNSARLEIGVGKKVTAGTMVNDGGNGGLAIKSNAAGSGSLKTTSQNLQATVERYIPAWGAWNEGWHLLSSPIIAEPVAGGWTPSGDGNDYDFYVWSESAANLNWRNQKDGTNGITGFIPGKGYLVAYQATDTKLFRDTLNVTDIPVSGLTHTTGNQYAGWHLLGNPFPCALHWGEGSWSKSTSIGQYAQLWNSTYKSYTVLDVNGVIPAMNGFMVYTSEDNGSLVIPADAMVHDGSSWYKEESAQILLVANDLDHGGLQETLLRFSDNGAAGFDPSEDCRFLAGFAPRFYSMAGDVPLSLNTLPSFDRRTEIPLSFLKNNSFRFSIELKEQIPEERVLLTDRLTNTTVDLSHLISYQFTSEASDDHDRFLLHFAGVGAGESRRPHQWIIHADGEEIIIKRNDGAPWDGEVNVYNMLGRRIANSISDDQQILRIPVKRLNGYCIVMVIHQDWLITEKIFYR